MDQAVLGAAVIGIVNLAFILFPNLTTLHKVILAVVVGALFPYIPLVNPAVQGIQVALASSGIYKLSQVVSKK